MAQTKREKGLAFQRWAKKFLEERGWIVRNFTSIPKKIRKRNPKTGQWEEFWVYQNQDCFGADLIARQFDKVFDTTRLHWIQVSLDPGVQKRVEEFKKYFQSTFAGEQLQIWIKVKPGEVNIKRVVIANREAHVHDLGKIIRGKFYAKEEMK